MERHERRVGAVEINWRRLGDRETAGLGLDGLLHAIADSLDLFLPPFLVVSFTLSLLLLFLQARLRHSSVIASPCPASFSLILVYDFFKSIFSFFHLIRKDIYLGRSLFFTEGYISRLLILISSDWFRLNDKLFISTRRNKTLHLRYM